MDTTDWYTEANQLFPEDTDTIETRYDLITEHYKTRPVPLGKSVCVIVATHGAFNMSLPQRFNAQEKSAMGLIYAASWQTIIKLNPDGTRDPSVIIEELNDDYIQTKK